MLKQAELNKKSYVLTVIMTVIFRKLLELCFLPFKDVKLLTFKPYLLFMTFIHDFSF